ncbi:MAG: nitroreductase family protein [Planctomycetota bacterium]|jgi:nitroreductase
MTDETTTIDRIIRERRTINNFQPEQPPDQTIIEAIDAARWAPNHHQTEPWQFHLLGSETVAAIVDINARLVTEAKGEEAGEAKRQRWSGIPGWLSVTCPRSPDEPLREQEDYAACCCAIQNLSLALWSRGIGMKWTTGAVTRHPDYFAALGLDPDSTLSVGMLWYGYAQTIPEQRRRPVDDILNRLP